MAENIGTRVISTGICGKTADFQVSIRDVREAAHKLQFFLRTNWTIAVSTSNGSVSKSKIIHHMKTNTIVTSSESSSPLLTVSGPSRLSGLGKTLLGTMCVSLVSFATIPQAQAGKVNGRYEVKKTTGSIRLDGDKIDIPDALVQRIAGIVDSKITIQNRTLKLKKKGAVKLVENIADELNVDVEASVTGSSSVKLRKSGDIAEGRTARPITTSFEGEFFNEDFSGELIARVTATVERKTLTIVVRFSGDAIGSDFSGRVKIVAKR